MTFFAIYIFDFFIFARVNFLKYPTMKIGLVNCISLVSFDETSLESGVGGAQTYVICLSKALADMGHEVTVVCQCFSEHTADGVRWIPLSNIFSVDIDYSVSRLWRLGFEAVIVSRPEYNVLNAVLRSGIPSYLVFHGLNEGLCIDGGDMLRHPGVRGVVTLTSWHAEYMKGLFGLESSAVAVIPNGISPDDFIGMDEPHPVDHSILWSSEPQRGLDILCALGTKIRKHIHDFGIYVSSPSYCANLPENDSYVYLGHLSKSSLYGQMHKHAVWFYPSVFRETFCITALEACMSGNMPVLPVRYGPSDIFAPFADIIGMKYNFEDNWQEASEEAVEIICRNILDYDAPHNCELRKSIRDFIICNFTWKKVVAMYSELLAECNS